MDVIIDNEPIIVENEDGEDFTMVCTEDLDPIEKEIDVIDFENPTQLTDDQFAIQVLDIISFAEKDILSNISFWNKRTREYKVLRNLLLQNDVIYPKWKPVIFGNKLEVSPKKMTEIAKEERELLAGDQIECITMDELLRRRYSIVSSSTDTRKIHSKLLYTEQNWSTLRSDISYIKHQVREDTEGSIGFKNPLRRTYLFKDQDVSLIGFLYAPHSGSSQQIVFDISLYLDDLKKLNVGDFILVYDNKQISATNSTVSRIENDILYFKTGNDEKSISISQIDENSVFVYPKETEHIKYHKPLTRVHNLLVKFEGVETNLKKVESMVLPSMNEIVEMYANEVETYYSWYDFAELFHKYGYPLKRLDEESYSSIRLILSRNIARYLKELKKGKEKLQIKKHVFKPKYTILDFKKHETSMRDYPLFQEHVDTEYSRMKYLMSQGDDGLVFFTRLIEDYCDKVFSITDKNINQYEKDLSEVHDLLQRYRNVIDDTQCSNKSLPEVKKVYNSITDLEKDNFNEIPDIKNGDFAKLVHGEGHYTLYRRAAIQDSVGYQHIWVKDQIVTSKGGCTVELPKGADLQKDKCVYDTSDSLCKSREYEQTLRKVRSLEKKQEILGKLIYFQRNYASIKANIKTHIDSFLPHTDRLIAKGSTLTYSNLKDYSSFVGDVNELDENRLLQAEQGENVRYNILNPERDDIEIEKNTNINEHIGIVITNYFGIKLNDDDYRFITQNHDIYNSKDKYYTEIRKEQEVEQMKLDKQIKKVEEYNRTIAVDEKTQRNLGKQLDKMMNEFSEQYRKRVRLIEERIWEEFNKTSVILISALFIVKVQLKLPDVTILQSQPRCVIGFEGFPLNDKQNSLLNYVTCVLKQMSTNDTLFKPIVMMDKEQIMNEIRKSIKHILKEMPFLDFKEVEKRIMECKKKEKVSVHYPEWQSFRPILEAKGTEPTSKPANYIKVLYQLTTDANSITKIETNVTFLKEYDKDITFHNLTKNTQNMPSISLHRQQGKYNVVMKSKEDSSDTTSDGFTQRDIVISNTAIFSARQKGISVNTIIQDKELAKAIESLGKDDLPYWNRFSTENGRGRLTALMDYAELEQSVKSNVLALLFEFNVSDIVQLRNALKTFLFNDMRSILGKIVNFYRANERWINSLPQLSKEKKENKLIQSILDIPEGLAEVQGILRMETIFKEQLQVKIVHACELLSNVNYILPTPQGNILVESKKQIYVLIYIFSYVNSMIISVLHNNQNIFEYPKRDITEENQYKTVTRLIQFTVTSLLSKVKQNMFQTEVIKMNQEKQREKKKEDILKAYERLTEEEVRLITAQVSLGMVTTTQINDIADVLRGVDEEMEFAQQSLFDEEKTDQNDAMKLTMRSADSDVEDDD
jgi:hypothetical protein